MKQWFKGNTVKCVLVLDKWDLNVWYDFRKSTLIFVALSPVIKADFLLIPAHFKTAIQLPTHHRHHWD